MRGGKLFSLSAQSTATVKRRTYLATAVGVVGAVAGCTGSSESDGTETPAGDTSPPGSAPFEHPGTMETTFVTNGDYPTDGSPADGYPPEMAEDPSAPDADPSTFDTVDVEGETVRLAPIDVVQRWYHRGEARVVDARGAQQYKRAHVYGSVLSPAQRGAEGGGIEGWPFADRVVTYCGCPHHLSSIRAAGLQKAGFEDVYALDEGFLGRPNTWYDRDYPMAGTDFAPDTQASLSEWEITGRTDADYAGEYVWASAARQYEAAPIQSDGSYRLHLMFTGIDAGTAVEVKTPDGTVEKPLGEVGTRL